MKMMSSKWIATVASILIQCSCGASYAFGIYSSLMKSTQNYDQSTLDTVSVFKDIGANAGILSGLLYSAVAITSSRRPWVVPSGPWVVHLFGAVQCFVGYFFIWLAVTGAISRPPVALMCLFMFLAAHAQTFFNTANVVTAVRNFPEYGGTAVGIMKGFLGLSGAILIQVYQTILRSNPSRFLLMLALLPTLVSLLLMCSVRTSQTDNVNDKKNLNSFSLVSVIVAMYLMVIIIMENIFTFPLSARIVTIVVLLSLLASPTYIAIRATKDDPCALSEAVSTSSDQLPDYNHLEKSLLPNEANKVDELTTECVQHEARSGDAPQVGEQMNILQAMRDLNFWLLFVAMLCGMGSGLATINNISQIGESLDYTIIERSTLVSLWSIWNFLGRFGAGYLSDILLHKQGWARPLFMAFTLATMTAGHVVIASGFSGNLYIGSVIVGVCYGSQWSLMPTITSEIFGVLHMGTIFNTIAIASPVGSYIFSVRVIGHIYDQEASGETKSCHGTRCFMLSFFFMACVSLCGFLVAMILFLKTRRFYTRVLLKHLRRATRH